MKELSIILASSSPTRKKLLSQVKIFPDKIIHPDIDETPIKKEKPRDLAMRLAYQKAIKIASDDTINNCVIIAADTVSVVGGKNLGKATSDQEVKSCLKALSGRRHSVYTGLCIIKKQDNKIKICKKLVKTIVKFKRLTNDEIDLYCALKEGINKAGGCAISGYSEGFITYIAGSYSGVSGLPLYETLNILKSFNIKPRLE